MCMALTALCFGVVRLWDGEDLSFKSWGGAFGLVEQVGRLRRLRLLPKHSGSKILTQEISKQSNP